MWFHDVSPESDSGSGEEDSGSTIVADGDDKIDVELWKSK